MSVSALQCTCEDMPSTPVLAYLWPVADVLGPVCIVQRADSLLSTDHTGADGGNDAGFGSATQGVPQQPRQLGVPEHKHEERRTWPLRQTLAVGDLRHTRAVGSLKQGSVTSRGGCVISCTV